MDSQTGGRMKQIIIKYLNRNYYIKDLGIYTKDNKPQFISDMLNSVGTFCGINEFETYRGIKAWLLENGFNKNNYDRDLFRHRFGPHLPFSEEFFISSPHNYEVLHIIRDSINEYFDLDEHRRNVLRNIVYIKDLIPFLKSMGYALMGENEIQQINYDGIQEQYVFYQMTYNEWNNERQNNPYWKDWIRAKEHNEKA